MNNNNSNINDRNNYNDSNNHMSNLTRLLHEQQHQHYRHNHHNHHLVDVPEIIAVQSNTNSQVNDVNTDGINERSPLLNNSCGYIDNYGNKTIPIAQNVSTSLKYNPKSKTNIDYSFPVLVSGGISRIKEFIILIVNPSVYFYVLIFELLNILYGLTFGNYIIC